MVGRGALTPPPPATPLAAPVITKSVRTPAVAIRSSTHRTPRQGTRALPYKNNGCRAGPMCPAARQTFGNTVIAHQ